MRKINYPLIVSDFDGTLVQSNGEIAEESKRSIEEYINNGGKFAISTGRLPLGILKRAQELNLKGIVCCCQGAVIMDIETQERLLDAKLPYETTLKIVEKMEELGLHIQLYGEWDYYSNMQDEALFWYEKAVGSKAKLIIDKPISEFVKENKFEAYKVLAMVEPSKNAGVLHTLKACNFENCEITKSADVLVEVINAQYSKGTAVKFLADHYSIPLEKVVAIGDQWNDVAMVEIAGLGVAVKNADEKLKEVAKYVSEYTNEEGAVGKIIQQFG